MIQFARKDQVIAAATETRLAGIRRQPTAGRVSRLKTAKSTTVVATPTTQKRMNCLAGSIVMKRERISPSFRDGPCIRGGGGVDPLKRCGRHAPEKDVLVAHHSHKGWNQLLG